MRIRIVAGILLVLLLIVTACSTSPGEQQQGPEVGGEAEKEATKAAEPPAEYDPAVAALRDKGLKETNFRYAFISKVRDEFGNMRQTADYDVVVRDDKAKRVYLNPTRWDKEVFYTEVYLDNTAKKVTLVCARTTGTLCAPFYKKAFVVNDYETYKIPFTILDVMKGISPDAKVIGTSVIDNRKVTIIAYADKEGKRHKVYMDNFYGLPLRHEVRIEENEKLVMVQEDEFRRMVAGHVNKEDVVVPADYEVQS